MYTIDTFFDQEDFEDNILENNYFLKMNNIIREKSQYPINIYSDFNNNNLNKKRCPSIEVFQEEKEKEKVIEILSKSSSHTSLTLFNIVNYKKRGKESKKTNRIEHLSSNFDNLQRKIQVHFLTFIINVSNDVLKSEFGNKTPYNFKHIDYQLKKIINYKYFNLLRTLTIKELLKMRISPKNKKYPIFINITTLEKVCKESKFIDKFLDMKFLVFFNKFYYSEDKKIDKITFEGKEIILSKNTKSFYNLLKKNENHRNLLIDTAKSVYFNGYKTLIGNNLFKTIKNENNLINLKE